MRATYADARGATLEAELINALEAWHDAAETWRTTATAAGDANDPELAALADELAALAEEFATSLNR